MQENSEPRIHDLTYEWPVNIFRYEARILGFNLIEIGVLIGGLLTPIALLGPRAGALVVSAFLILTLLLCVRRIERLGNRTAPVFLWQRWRERREPRIVVLPLIMGMESAIVRVQDPDSDTEFIVE